MDNEPREYDEDEDRIYTMQELADRHIRALAKLTGRDYEPIIDEQPTPNDIDGQE